ncbi:MAG: cell envelope integrity protein TolA [Telluria sp.]
MPDHSHSSPAHTGYCEHCGQALPSAVPGYGSARVNRVGLAVTVALHVLLLAVFLLKPEKDITLKPPTTAGGMVYVSPIADKPKAQPKPQPRKQASKVAKQQPEPRMKVERLPDTITLPDEKPVKLAEEPPKKLEAPPEEDMAARIARRRAERGQSEAEPLPESEAGRGMKNALANIAAANGRSGDDKNDTGGVFSITDQSFSSAQLKFRGWNPNFKRRWLQQVTVELGTEPDIETAIIKKMIELSRKEKKGDFDWDSRRLQRVVKMSARVQDTEELQAFLFQEMFPEHKSGRR